MNSLLRSHLKWYGRLCEAVEGNLSWFRWHALICLLQAPPRLKRLFYHPHFSSLSQVIGFMLKSIYAYALMDTWIYDISALWEENNTIQRILAFFLLSLNKNIQIVGLPVPNMKKRQYAWMMVPWQKCDDEAKWRNVMQTLILRNSCQPPGETFRSCD